MSSVMKSRSSIRTLIWRSSRELTAGCHLLPSQTYPDSDDTESKDLHEKIELLEPDIQSLEADIEA